MPEITPAPPALPARDRALLYVAAGSSALALVLAVALVAALGARSPSAVASAATKAAPTPPLAVIVPTAAILPDLPTADGQRYPVGALPVALIAYDAPGGATIGAVEAGRAYRVIAQAEGGDWLQIAVSVGGQVWVRAADFGTSTIVRVAQLRDLTPPTPQPTPAPPPPQIAAAQIAADPQPAVPTIEPTPNADGMVVIEDSPGRYEAVMPPPAGATATPEGAGWGGIHGGGGSWAP
jgi:hypothetical protein